MTTRLAGQPTRFLPFNRGHDRRQRATRRTRRATGRATCGSGSGRATPGSTCSAASSTSSGRRRARPAAKRAARSVIFPRYHQWDAVLQLEADARERRRRARATSSSTRPARASRNTIAWLAHRLSTLHDAPTTQGVRQGRRHHRPASSSTGSSRTRSTSSSTPTASWRGSTRTRQQLAEALAGEQARIIITTLQKFPFVLDKVAELGQRRYAVIVDEAHSSQTGEAAKDLQGGARRGVGRGSSSTAAEADGRPRTRRRTRRGRARRERWRPAAGSRTCRSSPSPRRRRPGRWSCSARKDADGALRAVPPVLDAPGDRGGLHPRRARQLHDLRDLLADRARRSPTTPSTTPRKAQARDRPVRRRCTRTTSPRRPRSSSSTSARTRRHKIGGQGQGDGRHLVAPARRPLQAGASTATSRQGLRRHRARSSRSPARSTTTAIDVHRAEDERLPRDRRPPTQFDSDRVPAS